MAAYDLQFSDVVDTSPETAHDALSGGGKRLSDKEKDPCRGIARTHGDHVQFTSSDAALNLLLRAGLRLRAFERTPTGWRRTSPWLGMCEKHRRALGDDLGALLDEYSSDQNDVSVPRTKRYWRTESADALKKRPRPTARRTPRRVS